MSYLLNNLYDLQDEDYFDFTNQTLDKDSSRLHRTTILNNEVSALKKCESILKKLRKNRKKRFLDPDSSFMETFEN